MDSKLLFLAFPWQYFSWCFSLLCMLEMLGCVEKFSNISVLPQERIPHWNVGKEMHRKQNVGKYHYLLGQHWPPSADEAACPKQFHLGCVSWKKLETKLWWCPAFSCFSPKLEPEWSIRGSLGSRSEERVHPAALPAMPCCSQCVRGPVCDSGHLPWSQSPDPRSLRPEPAVPRQMLSFANIIQDANALSHL